MMFDSFQDEISLTTVYHNFAVIAMCFSPVKKLFTKFSSEAEHFGKFCV